MNRTEIEKFIKSLDLTPEPAYFNPCPNIQILQRLIINLVFAYEKLEQVEKADMYKQIYKILSDDGHTGS